MWRSKLVLFSLLLWPNGVAAGERDAASLEAMIERELKMTIQATELHKGMGALRRERESLAYALDRSRQRVEELSRRNVAYRKVHHQRSGHARLRARKLYRLVRGGAAELAMEAFKQGELSAVDRVLKGRTIHRLVEQDAEELKVFNRAEARVKGEVLELAREASALAALSMVHRLQGKLLEASASQVEPVLARSQKERSARERRERDLPPASSYRELRKAKRALIREQAASPRKAQWPTRIERPVAGGVVGVFGKYEDALLRVPMERKGLELRAKRGEVVRAVAGGKVAFVGYLSGFEEVVVIDHGDGHLSMIGRLWSVQVQEGEEVQAGTALGQAATKVRRDGLGRTVYLELRHGERAIDPLPLLRH